MPDRRRTLLFSPAPRVSTLPDWQLALWLDGPDPFATAADSRIAMYLYSGIVVVLAMVALAGLVARYVGRQIRLTRLRNDLIATVSHELKTPLSSIRALSDTLLDGRYHDEQQHREYLQLAAKENERLSRLIDNFLAFSRMERNKQTFELAEVEVEELVAAAVSAVGEKFDSSGGRLEADVAAGLPKITGGCGLGLSIVQFIVTAHGGSVSVSSQPSRVGVARSRSRCPLAKQSRPRAAKGPVDTMATETVLIIEDDPTMLRVLKDNFEFSLLALFARHPGRAPHERRISGRFQQFQDLAFAIH